MTFLESLAGAPGRQKQKVNGSASPGSVCTRRPRPPFCKHHPVPHLRSCGIIQDSEIQIPLNNLMPLLHMSPSHSWEASITPATPGTGTTLPNSGSPHTHPALAAVLLCLTLDCNPQRLQNTSHLPACHVPRTWHRAENGLVGNQAPGALQTHQLRFSFQRHEQGGDVTCLW